ncbi:unnamed protein product [Polarella glacialis]|uniref:EF-hand domain-containing protein n=1 Tax=Polarella glacialis TaxID=89957 RepID=A0A813HRN6_POLGL|nr:unnamed protein product [Polarella glacialis]
MMYALEANQNSNSSARFGASNLRALRIVRITRIIRVTKIARVMRFIKALRTLVASIICTLRSLLWAMILLCLIVYVFSILFTQAVGDFLDENSGSISNEDLILINKYWGGVGSSMLTLFMSISSGVSWELPLGVLQQMSPVWVLAFVFYISFTYFAVLNVVTGVFCQSAIESAQSDHDMAMQSIVANKETHMKKNKSLFKDLDDDDSGYLTFEELRENISKESVQTYFEHLEIDVDDAWNLFKLLDVDGGAVIEIEEFLMGCLRLRGSAKALELAKLHYEQNRMAKKQSTFMEHVEAQLRKIDKRAVVMLHKFDEVVQTQTLDSAVHLSDQNSIVKLKDGLGNDGATSWPSLILSDQGDECIPQEISHQQINPLLLLAMPSDAQILGAEESEEVLEM